ncbi:uncharacterized protein LOC129764798 [Toxorhynchites rutilus septentrionalis]|uniref:uncharacterized protein LOC129764798 n=1 Tax=Toxorhynchites rutilus septentrionalis TaxID=329112 RepID=UPI002479A99B|nr:uncharacterized protein LOC129764798 [Toxorhynchites rutilus septentrionalis]
MQWFRIATKTTGSDSTIRQYYESVWTKLVPFSSGWQWSEGVPWTRSRPCLGTMTSMRAENSWRKEKHSLFATTASSGNSRNLIHRTTITNGSKYWK